MHYRAGNAVGAGATNDFFGSLDRFKASNGLCITTPALAQQAREK
ncbi:restriction endonuclease [Acidithiobacillus thiooxidans]|nr:restriction endonuclease [Acidithiobacillus thiooxidans]